MTDTTFEALAEFGISEEEVVEAREEIVHSMFAEEFLAHFGIDVPEEPSDEFYENADRVIAHYGVLGMKWGRRRNADGTVTVNKAKTAGNHPGHSDRKEPKLSLIHI